MSDEGTRPGTFDARMRRHFSDADTSPGFEARVMQRIAALRTCARGGASARAWSAGASSHAGGFAARPG